MRRGAIQVRLCSAVLAAAVLGGVAGHALARDAAARDGTDVSPGDTGISTEALGGASADLGGVPADGGIKSRPTQGPVRGTITKSDVMSARQAVESGEVRPFGWLLKKLNMSVPGDVVRVRLNRHAKSWTYDVTVLNASGRYVLVSLNAATGAIISKKYR